MINKDMGGKIQAELENIALIWFGWYRLYREVLGTLLGVNRNEEALLLAEASLKVRIDNKQNEKVLEYRKQMQAAVLAIALSTKNYDRAYPGMVQDPYFKSTIVQYDLKYDRAQIIALM